MEKKKTVSVKVNFDNALLTFLLMISCASCPSVGCLGNRTATPILKEKAGSKNRRMIKALRARFIWRIVSYDVNVVKSAYYYLRPNFPVSDLPMFPAAGAAEEFFECVASPGAGIT